MNQPTQNQIDHWLRVSRRDIARGNENLVNGFYARKSIPLQSHYVGEASDYASLARAKFLNGDPLEGVRAEFANAARHVMKSFTMAYDPSDPDYQGERADLSEVSETIGIEGMNWALMSADFKLAAEVGSHYRTRPDGYMLGLDTNRYANALALTLQERQKEALPLLLAQFEDYKKRTPKSPADRHYYSLILALFGIVAKDREKFHQGIELQLKSHWPYAQGEAKDTDEEFICDHAVALTILAQRNLLWPKVAQHMLPGGLLLQNAPLP